MVSHVIRHCLVSNACVLPLQAEGEATERQRYLLEGPVREVNMV